MHLHPGIVLFAEHPILNVWLCFENVCLDNCSVICTETLCTASDTFRILGYSELCIFSFMPAYLIKFRVIKAYSAYWGIIKAYSAPCVALAYSQPCHILSLSPGMIRTGGLFKILWNVNQAYSKPYHGVLFSHIQVYSECLHVQKPGILGILEYSEFFHNCIPTHIQNSVIFTKIFEYSELWHI